jgi:hypothetical protein
MPNRATNRTITLFAAWACVASACGGSGGGASLQSRCESWCERRNAEDDCGADFSCSATCTSIILSAGDRCRGTVEAFVSCSEAETDLCTTGGAIACMAENTAIQMCAVMPADGAPPDAGGPVCRIPGTYSGVTGGVPATACGRMLSTFDSGVLVVTETATGVSLTLSNSSAVGGDTVDCAGTIDGCTVSATCSSGSGSTVRYELEFSTFGFDGMAYIQVDDCSLPYSISGRR